MPQKYVSRPLAPSIPTADTRSEHQHCSPATTDGPLPSSFRFRSSTRLFSHYNLFKTNRFTLLSKAFSDILFLEEIKVKCLSITCFQSRFSLFIFQEAPFLRFTGHTGGIILVLSSLVFPPASCVSPDGAADGN